MKGECFILKVFDQIKKFFLKYKSYIIISIILIISLISIVIQNIQDKSKITVNEQEIQKNKYEGKIAVYITGEVENPGVYYIEEDSRLDDLLQICGGFTNLADISELNLAEKLNDADKIDVPKLNNNEKTEDESNSEDINSDLININTASKEELKNLKGIGDTLAENIINYRKENKFDSIEDILNVNGIGESKFESIKEYICVN